MANKPAITTSINAVGVTTKTKKTSFGLLKRRSSQEDGKRVKTTLPSKSSIEELSYVPSK